MGEFSRDYAVDDSTGGTIAVAANVNRNEVILQNQGAERVYISFSEFCDGSGLYLDMDMGLVISGAKAKFDIYMACTSGLTATVSICDFPV